MIGGLEWEPEAEWRRTVSSKSTRGRVGRMVVMVMVEGGAGDELMLKEI